MMTNPIRSRGLLLAIAGVCLLLVAPLQAQSVATKTATLLWQVDGSESGEPFGDLRDYIMLRNGAVWALDFKDQTIRRWDAAGKPLGTIGRKGSGPGEMQNANGLIESPDGSVWVNDPSNGRFNLYSGLGAPLRSVTVSITGWAYRWGAWFDSNGDLVELTIGEKWKYRRLSSTGIVRGEVPSPDCGAGVAATQFYHGTTNGKGGMTASYPFTTGGGIAADGKGNFWCASPLGTRAARLAYRSVDTIATTAIELLPIPVSTAERDEAIAAAQNRLAKYATNDFDKSKVPTSRPGIAAMNVDADGRLWLTHAAPAKATSSTWSVFDSGGKALFRLTLPVRTNPYMPVVAKGNELVVSTLDGDDVVSIARYRLK